MRTSPRLVAIAAASALVSASLMAGAAGASPQPTLDRLAPHASALVDLEAVQLPELSGIGEVGGLLSVTEPVWNLPGVTTKIEWLRDGVPIPGATGWTYVPTLDDGGTELSALVTGTVLGVAPVEIITNALGIPLPGTENLAPAAAGAPTISGTPQVGNLLTGTAPTWLVNGSPDTTVTNTYQWLSAGAPIPGATSSTYTVAPTDAAKTLALKVTGTKGDQQGVATSAPLLVLLGDALTALIDPSIDGIGKVGELLEVKTGDWGLGTPPTFSYQWLRGPDPITGATGSTYVVAPADAGKDLAVQVTAVRTGFAPGSATSPKLAIAKMSSTTKASLVKKKIPRKARGLLKVTLSAQGTKPTGVVKVFRGSKMLKKYSIAASDNGSRTFKLPKLKPGRHKLKAKYMGNASTSRSQSKRVILTVKR